MFKVASVSPTYYSYYYYIFYNIFILFNKSKERIFIIIFFFYSLFKPPAVNAFILFIRKIKMLKKSIKKKFIDYLF